MLTIADVSSDYWVHRRECVELFDFICVFTHVRKAFLALRPSAIFNWTYSLVKQPRLSLRVPEWVLHVERVEVEPSFMVCH